METKNNCYDNIYLKYIIIHKMLIAFHESYRQKAKNKAH